MSTRRVSVSLLELMKENEPAPPPPPPPHPSQKLPSWVETATPRNATTHSFFPSHPAATEDFQPPPPPAMEEEETSEQNELPPPSLPPPSPGAQMSPEQDELPPPSLPPPSPPKEGLNGSNSDEDVEDAEHDVAFRPPTSMYDKKSSTVEDGEENGESLMPPPPPFEMEDEQADMSLPIPTPPPMSPPSPPRLERSEVEGDNAVEEKEHRSNVEQAASEHEQGKVDDEVADEEDVEAETGHIPEDTVPVEQSSAVESTSSSSALVVVNSKGLASEAQSVVGINEEKTAESQSDTIRAPPTPPQQPQCALASGIVGISRPVLSDSLEEEVESRTSNPETDCDAPALSSHSRGKDPEEVESKESVDSFKTGSEVSTQDPSTRRSSLRITALDKEVCTDKATAAIKLASEARASIEADDDSVSIMQPPNYPPPDFLERAEKLNLNPLDTAVEEILRKRQLRRRKNRVKFSPQRRKGAASDRAILNQCKQVWSKHSLNKQHNLPVLHRPIVRSDKPERVMVVGDGFAAFDKILRPFEESFKLVMQGSRFLAVEETVESSRAIRVSAWIDQQLNRLFWAKDRSFGPRRSVNLHDILQVYVEDSAAFRIVCANVSRSYGSEDGRSALDIRLSHQDESVVKLWVSSLLLLCNAASVLQQGRSTIKQKRNNSDVVC